MSRWIVSKTHIDAIVTGAIRHRCSLRGVLTTPATADALGLALWQANHVAVNARYGESLPTPPYRWRPVELAPPALLKAVDCYAYQTICTPDWLNGLAVKRLCDELDVVIPARLGIGPDALRATDAYEAAPWGIDDDPEAETAWTAFLTAMTARMSDESISNEAVSEYGAVSERAGRWEPARQPDGSDR